jgi:hypothetical protein
MRTNCYKAENGNLTFDLEYYLFLIKRPLVKVYEGV